MSETVGVPSTTLSGVSAGEKDTFWKQNYQQELNSRSGYPHGHTLNPRDGFWDWYRKYQFINNLDNKGQTRKVKTSSAKHPNNVRSSLNNYYIPSRFRENTEPLPFVFKKPEPAIRRGEYFEKWKANNPNRKEAYQRYLNTHFPKRPERAHPNLHKLSKTVPYTSGIERAADILSGENTGKTLLGYDYIGPGNPIYSGDDETLESTDKIAKEHDVQYSLIAENSKTQEELRELTDKADTEGIEKFWNNSHIGEQLLHGNIPDWGSLFGAIGLLGKRSYERTFGQTYPSPDVLSKFYFVSVYGPS